VYAAKAAEAAGDTKKKMRRLAQELRALQGAQGLPLQAAASILLRHDGERPDKMRALITGALPRPRSCRMDVALRSVHAVACLARCSSTTVGVHMMRPPLRIWLPWKLSDSSRT